MIGPQDGVTASAGAPLARAEFRVHDRMVLPSPLGVSGGPLDPDTTSATAPSAGAVSPFPEHAKWGWALRRLSPAESYLDPRAPSVAPRVGDVIMVRIEKIGYHSSLVGTDNRKVVHRVRGRRHPTGAVAHLARPPGPPPRRLEDAGLLRRQRAPHRDFYFASDITWDDRKYLVFLRGENSRRLLLELRREPRLTAADLSSRLRLSRSTVYFHLTRLVQGGLLHGERDNTTRRYRVAHPEQALRLLESYRENFREEVVSRFVEVWGPLLPQR